jgi:hypothetical protein
MQMVVSGFCPDVYEMSRLATHSLELNAFGKASFGI